MYINGAIYRTDTGKPVPNYVSRINAWLGKSEWGDSPFNGYMDEFRIYNSVLQQSDVEALYNDVTKSPTISPTVSPTLVPTKAPMTSSPTVLPSGTSVNVAYTIDSSGSTVANIIRTYKFSDKMTTIPLKR